MATRRTGHIEPRGRGKWFVRWPTGKDAEGKRGQKSKVIRGTRRDAENFLAEQVRQFEQGVEVNAGAQTFGSFLDRWLDDGLTHNRPRTQRGYRSTELAPVS